MPRKAAAGFVETTFVPITSLTKYARNARTHSPEQIDQLMKLIAKFGWTTPLLVDDEGGLIAGHGRVMAAEKLYASGATLRMADGSEIPTGCLPVNYARGWSDADKRAYILADNKVALNAGWDDDLLKAEFADLQGFDFDLSLTGFTPVEIDAIFAEPESPSPPDAPDEFKAFGEDIETEHACPKCGYKWSGKAS